MNTYFATKYASARDEVVALLADEIEGYGQRDDSSGDVNSPTGYFQLVTIPDDVDLLIGSYPGDPMPMLTTEYGVTSEDVAGSHIVFHDSQGFVSVVTYADETEARATFDCLSHRYDVWSEDDWNDGEPLADDNGWFDCPVPGHGRHNVSD